MRVSKRTDCALRTLFTLVEHHGKMPIPIRELTRRNDAPKRFLKQIMPEGKKRGWADSMTGQLGGYFLAENPGEIMLGEVVRPIDGILAAIDCVSLSGYNRRLGPVNTN